MAGWSKPTSANVMKVNCKGVFDRGMMKSAVGCIMRDDNGDWVRGNAGMMGLWVPVAAELWSIFYGLKMAWEKGEKNVLVESDCEEAVNQVTNPDPNFWFSDLVDMILSIRGEAWDACDVVCVPEASNEAATTLANAYLSKVGGLVELREAPAFMEYIIAAESN